MRATRSVYYGVDLHLKYKPGFRNQTRLGDYNSDAIQMYILRCILSVNAKLCGLGKRVEIKFFLKQFCTLTKV